MKKHLLRLFCVMFMLSFLCSTVSAAPPEVASVMMTYRTNEVEITGASGITINSGSFQVNQLNITSGQDPSGRNYVGQIHTLSNGKFTFEVGRKGSSAVANWWNQRMSSYNDNTINGDRTTFDHTAGDLNFAFIGDLTLNVTTSQYPLGIAATFPNVGLAQGSTGFSNNWWLGQTTGQHTKDSDGPNTLLAIGRDTANHTVFASFLRGGNGTNEVTLESIYIPNPAQSTVNSIANVESVFASLPVNGTQTNIQGFPGSYDPTTNHIQGYAQYDSTFGGRYAILTHSVSTAEYAHIVAGPKNSNTKFGFKTYLKDWCHPGGVCTIGDYLLVPNETDNSAHVALYDLRTLATQELRRVESFDLVLNHKAGAMAVTEYTDSNNVTYFLLVIAHLDGQNSVYHVYRAPTANGLENANFTEVGSFNFGKDFQGFSLIKEETTGRIYFIGLWSISDSGTYADYAYLYQLDTQSWNLSDEIDQIHMISTGGGAGVLGVHFRYGANAFADNAGNLILSATERNAILGLSLATNDWISTAQ